MNAARRTYTEPEPETATILLVDDDLLILRTVSRILSRLRPQWTLVCVTGAQAALEWLEQHDANLLVTDLSMPELSGSELLGRVSKLHPKLSCVVHSTNPELISPDLHRRYPVLSKPATATQLCEVLDAALESEATDQPNSGRRPQR